MNAVQHGLQSLFFGIALIGLACQVAPTSPTIGEASSGLVRQTPHPLPPTPSLSGVTWADDLAGSTDTGQFVTSVSGHAGTGGTVPVNATALAFAPAQAAPTLAQTARPSTSGTGATGHTLTIAAQPGQPSTGSTGGGGGSLVLAGGNAGAGGTTAPAGGVTLRSGSSVGLTRPGEIDLNAASGAILLQAGNATGANVDVAEGSGVYDVNVGPTGAVFGYAAIPFLTIGTGLQVAAITVTAAYTVDSNAASFSGPPDYLVLCQESGLTVTLPTPTPGRVLQIKDISGTAGTTPDLIVPTSGARIDGTSTFALTANYGAITLTSDGTDWWVIARN